MAQADGKDANMTDDSAGERKTQQSVLDMATTAVLDAVRDRFSSEELNAKSQQQSRAYKCLLHMSESDSIPFEDAAERAAYLRVYLRVHALMVDTAIKSCRPLMELLQKPLLRVHGIGGGPGSDAVGVLHYLESQGLAPRLGFSFYDKVKEWLLVWQDVWLSLPTRITLNATYVPFDVTNRTDVAAIPQWFAKAELVTMVKFASAVYFKYPLDFYVAMFRALPPGCIVMLIDNWCPWPDYDKFSEPVRRAAEECGMETLVNENKMAVQGQSQALLADVSLSQSQGHHIPKLPGWMLVLILRKPVTSEAQPAFSNASSSSSESKHDPVTVFPVTSTGPSASDGSKMEIDELQPKREQEAMAAALEASKDAKMQWNVAVSKQTMNYPPSRKATGGA